MGVKYLVVSKYGTIRYSYIGSDGIYQFDTVTEIIAKLAKGKRVAVIATSKKMTEEITDIFIDEFNINVKNYTKDLENISSEKLAKSLTRFKSGKVKSPIEVLIAVVNENPMKYFPEYFARNYSKSIMYLQAFNEGSIWLFDLTQKTLSLISPK